jgi:tetratricopeptide (TPR) repeat protein
MSARQPGVVTLCGSGRGEPSERVRACDLMLTSDSRGYAAVVTWRAQAKEQNGDATGALRDYEDALRIWPDAPSALLGIGRLHLAQGDLAAAQPYLRRAIEAHDSGIASDMLAAHALQNGDAEMALREYEAWLVRHPDNELALYGRGIARLRGGDEGGREDIARAEQISPRIRESFEERGIRP